MKHVNHDKYFSSTRTLKILHKKREVTEPSAQTFTNLQAESCRP